MKNKKNLIIAAVLAVAVLGLIVFGFTNLNSKHSEDGPLYTPPNYLHEANYIRAKDGDTLVVNDGEGDLTVRLIGIDTPESVHPDESKNTEAGKDASEHTKEILKDTKTVYLEFDQEKNDKYGRVLAYVWLSNDTSNINNMLNKRLINEGYAVPLEIPPNTKYADAFKQKQAV